MQKNTHCKKKIIKGEWNGWGPSETLGEEFLEKKLELSGWEE